MANERYTPPVHASVIGMRQFGAPSSATQLSREETNGPEWIACPYNRDNLKVLVERSAILPQCIRAYANNIPGYGIDVRYIEDSGDPDEYAEAEMVKAKAVIQHLCLENDTKRVFEKIIEAREIYGCAYAEVMRDLESGQVARIDFIEDTTTIWKSIRDEKPTATTMFQNGDQLPVQKRFCHYKQEVNGKIVFFREFGDPRVMNRDTGQYVELGEIVPPELQANEIIEFKLGETAYGEPRWQGCITGIEGAYRAEKLNLNYFLNGRHTPLLIFIRGGMLDEESENKLEHYMSSIKGEAGQHAFIVLCAESNGSIVANGQEEKNPDIELKDMSPMLQHDELFGEYMERIRRVVQSAFQLPDIYVGYTTDFNRATAQTAKEITEEQVFKSERTSLAWTLNHKLLAGFGFNRVEAYFKEPDLSNPEDLRQMLIACAEAGGVTPNKAREILSEQLGDQYEPYPEEWGNIPIQLSQAQRIQESQEPQINGMNATPDLKALGYQLNAQIQKAQREDAGDEVVSVMKSVKRLLEEMRDEAPES